MTHISTPTTMGPSTQTIDYLRQFARNYTPQKRIGKYIILYADENKTLGLC